MVIFLRDSDSVELDNSTNHEIMVHMESVGLGVTANNSRKVHHKTLADIYSTLSGRRQDSWPVVSPFFLPARPTVKSPSPILRRQVWIYSVNCEGTGREVGHLFFNHLKIISHLTVIQTKEPGQMSSIQLFKYLETLKNDLEYLELSLFPPSISTTLKDTTVYYSKMKELRILRFGKPLEWLNRRANSDTILELLRISERLEEIHNFPFLLNIERGPPGSALGQSLAEERAKVQVDLGAVTSFYFNGPAVLPFPDSEQGRDQFIDQTFALYNGDSCPCPALTYLKIESSRCYQTKKSVESLNRILRASKETLTSLEIFPLKSSQYTIELPTGLTKVKKLTLFDDLKLGLPFFSMDSSLHFPNLECVQLNLESVSAEALDKYFPLGTCQHLKRTVTRLKINMEVRQQHLNDAGTPGSRQWVKVTAIQKLGQLFPNVRQLELKPQKNIIGQVIQAGALELREILSVIPSVWPKVTHLTLILSQLGQLRGIQETFVTQTIPALTRLICLKFKFPAQAINTIKSEQLWKYVLENYMRKEHFPHLIVYVHCGWRMSRSGIEELNKFFEPLKGLPSCSFNF